MSSGEAGEWLRVKAVLAEVLELPEQERGAAADRACGDDPALGARLRSLLAACSAEEDRIGQLGQALDRSLSLADAPERRIGSTVGGYRLTKLIGCGGMGAVYRGEPLRGGAAVAVKLLHGGAPSPTARKRFEREGDRLAGLAHPRITSLVDRGVSPEGDPYYVMELVEGEPIDVYADRRRLDVTERIKLLIEVGAAVAYAHGRRVIHRDLKPSNILVRPSGEPALLDFGIAKLLDPIHEGRPATLTLEALAFTPGYSSPEQVAGEPVSPASDVYSLGAVGYALLAGGPPPVTVQFEPRRLARVFEAQGERRGEVAAARGASEDDLAAGLAGELGDVFLCACELDAGGRYPSVEAFVAELERYLDG